jgi:uncharacterized protein YggE
MTVRHATALSTLLLPAAFLLGSGATLRAQVAPGPRAASEILTSGDGEATLTPDRALLRVGMQTNAKTAADASARNAAKVEAVIAALRKLGYRTDSLRTVGFGVTPNYDYEGGRRLVDYQASATIAVTVHRLDRLGSTLDAVLEAGASDISGIAFESDREQEGRAVALERALRKARGDAAAIARAAGGRLGRLLEVSTQPQMRPMMAQAMEMRASNVVLPPQDVVVNVFVQARWEFVGGTE